MRQDVRTTRTRRRAALAMLLLAAVVGGCTASSAPPAALSGSPDASAAAATPSPQPSPTPSPAATPRATPTPLPALLGVLDAGGAGWAMAKEGDDLWIQVDPPVDAIVRVDTETGVATPLVKGGWKVVSGPEGLWVLCCDWLVKVDPATGKELLRIEMGGWVALADGAAWLLNEAGLHRIDPATGAVGDPIGPGGYLCSAGKDMVIAFGSAWLACKEGGVARLDIATEKVVKIEAPEGSHTFAVTEDAVWVTNYLSNTVSLIDPATNTASVIEGVGSGVGITVGDGYVWAADMNGIAKLDPGTGAIVGHVDLGFGSYYELVWDDGTIWASTRGDRILKVDPTEVTESGASAGG